MDEINDHKPLGFRPQWEYNIYVGDRTTMGVTIQCDVFLNTRTLQTNESLWRGKLCPIVKQKFLGKKKYIEQNF